MAQLSPSARAMMQTEAPDREKARVVETRALSKPMAPIIMQPSMDRPVASMGMA